MMGTRFGPTLTVLAATFRKCDRMFDRHNLGSRWGKLGDYHSHFTTRAQRSIFVVLRSWKLGA